MKLFLDRNKTLLPRVDAVYTSTRVAIFLVVLAYVASGNVSGEEKLALTVAASAYCAQLAVFIWALKGGFDLKLAYLSAICFDLVFIPLFIFFSGDERSSMFVPYYLTAAVAAYVLTIPFATVVTCIITATYAWFWFSAMRGEDAFGFVMRLGMLWVIFAVITYVSDHLRRSETRLVKLFDTLNQRTAELEKSQAQLEMIYENTRTMAGILEVDAVVKEVLRIMSTTLGYQHCGLVFSHKSGEWYWRARYSGGHANYHPKAMPKERSDLIRKVAALQEPVRHKDIVSRNDYLALSPNARSIIIVPMTSHGHCHGVLVAEAEVIDRFKERDVQQLTIVARSASMALETAELHKQTAELTIIDELTDTYNYRYFVQKLQEEKKRALRYSLPLSIIMVDIDWFKKLNDSYGHETGNSVLRELSRVIKGCIRDVDIFCRYGGEEFIVILPQTPQAEAAIIGERIRAAVEQTIIDPGAAGKVKVTVSVGISSYPENGKSQEDLVSIADQALYRAKESGKNLVCIA